jgi:hypothetical protein
MVIRMLRGERRRRMMRPIGDVRRELFLDGSHKWNGVVRDVTAELEVKGGTVDEAAVFKKLAKHLGQVALTLELAFQLKQ